MYCQKCGKSIAKGAQYCSRCGVRVGETSYTAYLETEVLQEEDSSLLDTIVDPTGGEDIPVRPARASGQSGRRWSSQRQRPVQAIPKNQQAAFGAQDAYKSQQRSAPVAQAQAETASNPLNAAIVGLLVFLVIGVAVALIFAFGMRPESSSPNRAGGGAHGGNVVVASVSAQSSSDSASSASGSTASSSGTSVTPVPRRPDTNEGNTTIHPITPVIPKPSPVPTPSQNPKNELQIYEGLVDYYNKAEDFDARVADLAEKFNALYAVKSRKKRESAAEAVNRLESEISLAWSSVINLNPPSSSENYEAWKDVCTLYECLWNRIDVISRAWAVSLRYDKPAGHEEEILAPIEADRVGRDNKYFTKYNELYPRVTIVKPSIVASLV